MTFANFLLTILHDVDILTQNMDKTAENLSWHTNWTYIDERKVRDTSHALNATKC